MKPTTCFIKRLYACQRSPYLRSISVAFSLTVFSMTLHLPDVIACASCGGTLSSDWASEQFSYTPGFKIDVRYDYLNQDQLRSGSKTISPQAASQVVNNGNPQEVEKYTKNNYVTLGVDYSASRDWGMNVQVPYIDRQHSTLGTGSDGSTPADGAYDSHTRNLGDIKIIGRYQGFTPQANFGVLYGVKLPTGSYTETGTSTDPAAPGGSSPIDRGLQPGTGTTDVLVGAYYSNGIGQNWDYFTQVLFQRALNSRNQYKPGDSYNVNLGCRYAGFSTVSPQLQVNYRYILRDEGQNADQVSTGGTLLYVSPGISASVNPQISVYGFIQLPLYQDVNGVQLTPRYIASLGVRYSF
ncbi:MAG TPA: TonB-dependent receptor [Nitrospirota bacterium]|nr:TonB-dependent receptor [Nitrospirota bacterium]